jgi:toxin YoeB
LNKRKKQKSESSDIQPSKHRIPGFSSKFKNDLAWWFKNDPKKASKILDLVTAVMQDPFIGVGKPEPLKYMASDLWSRRIDLEHRLVYCVGDTQIDFLTCRFHYE